MGTSLQPGTEHSPTPPPAPRHPGSGARAVHRCPFPNGTRASLSLCGVSCCETRTRLRRQWAQHGTRCHRRQPSQRPPGPSQSETPSFTPCRSRSAFCSVQVSFAETSALWTSPPSTLRLLRCPSLLPGTLPSPWGCDGLRLQACVCHCPLGLCWCPSLASQAPCGPSSPVFPTLVSFSGANCQSRVAVLCLGQPSRRVVGAARSGHDPRPTPGQGPEAAVI